MAASVHTMRLSPMYSGQSSVEAGAAQDVKVWHLVHLFYHVL